MIQDFSKFKRLFAFGCSHTNYYWPTWADLLSKEIPDVNYYNFGKIGLGNLFISSQVAEVNKRFKFTENDLVVIMWSSFAREDRYFNGNWRGGGNIFSQNIYPKFWVKEFADPDGYIIRDYSLIELTKGYLDNLSCTTLMLSSVTTGDPEKNPNSVPASEKLAQTYNILYKSTVENIPTPLMDWVYMSVPESFVGHTYMQQGKIVQDKHVSPKYHYEYLKYLNFNLTDKSKNFAYESVDFLNNNTSIDIEDMKKHFNLPNKIKSYYHETIS